MKRIPEEDAETAEGVLKQLLRSLQLLASPAQDQAHHFPVSWIDLPFEMADDFGHWAGCVSTYWEVPQEQKTRLTLLDDFLSEMSGSHDAAFWTDEALFTDPRWEEVRIMAQAALVSFGWPVEVPPRARLLPNGSVIDGKD